VPEPILTEPWLSFLHDLDDQVVQPTELHCLGGFVILEMYDFARVTADLDVIEVRGGNPAALAALGGKGSDLHQRHKVFLDIVTVASVPENYETRLIDLVPEQFKKLRLRAFEPHDLVLAKLARNIDRDREDVRRLARHPGLNPALLVQRYRDELRHQLGRSEREDLTLELWMEMIAEVQASIAKEPPAGSPRSRSRRR
jgi:hypothetical protein